MRVAITGAGGRLGSALVERLIGEGAEEPGEVFGWTRAEFDLDAPDDIGGRVAAVRPDLVIHAAAWTDVDGCAREPELALRRNGLATAALARACVDTGASMILVSTNEVFDGTRLDRRGYRTNDAVAPANPYGHSKLAGEQAATSAFAGSTGGTVAIVRTAWLFGLGKPDFPARIAAAARSASSEGRAMRLVNDEIGSPTYVPDLAYAIIRLARARAAGIHHVVNAGMASRAEWGRDVFDRLGIDVQVEEVSLDAFDRPSRPPRWGVLEPTPLPGGPLRHWQSAMADRFTAPEPG